MSQLLTTGQVVQTDSGLSCKVGKMLGSGGQGEVYQATLGNSTLALKWYYPHYIYQDPDLRRRLEQVVSSGSPNDKFLWPIAIVSEQGDGFGYIMGLREPRYRSILDWVKRRVNPSFKVLVTTGLELADSFLQLHAKGLCYRDISFNNIFFEPETGRILICDNDNVTIDGSELGGILGTPDFMAPEVVRREALPSKQTDLFSLAVLLFYIFHIHHPLYGKKVMDVMCLDLPARMQLCGKEPVFIFDSDRSNEAVDLSIDPTGEAGANALAFWPIYPQSLQNLFIQSFTEGLRDPKHGRVRESVWRAEMVRLRDSIIYCSHCKADNFYDVNAFKASGGKPGKCWSCHQEVQLPPRMRIGNNIVMLNHNTQLFLHHIDRQKMYDFSQAVAAITQHSNDSNAWALQNLSAKSWTATTLEQVQEVKPRQSVVLRMGLKINFGNTEGEIRL